MSFNFAKEKMNKLGNAVKDAATNASEVVSDTASKSYDTVSSKVNEAQGVISDSVDSISDTVTSTATVVGDKAGRLGDRVTKIPSDVSNSVGDAIDSANQAVTDKVDSIGATVENKLTATKDELAATASSVASQAGAIAVGGAITAGVTAITYTTFVSMFTPVAIPVAAGMALFTIFDGVILTGALWVDAVDKADKKREGQKYKRAIESLSKYKTIPETVQFETTYASIYLNNTTQTVGGQFIKGKLEGKDFSELQTEVIESFIESCDCDDTKLVLARVLKNRIQK